MSQRATGRWRIYDRVVITTSRTGICVEQGRGRDRDEFDGQTEGAGAAGRGVELHSVGVEPGSQSPGARLCAERKWVWLAVFPIAGRGGLLAVD